MNKEAVAQQERGRELHKRALILDACNTAQWDDEYICRLKASGVKCIWKTLVGAPRPTPILKQISTWLHLLDKHSTVLAAVRTASELERAVTSGRIAVVLTFQHTRPFEDDVDLVRIFYEMGVRVVQMTYNSRCYAGDGCLEPNDGGLSTFGREIVAELNRLGIVVDLSHASHRTALDAIEVSTHPVIFSHSNAFSIIPHPRNIADDVIRAMAVRGGVMGIAGYLPMLSRDLNQPASVSDLIAHVDHVVQLVGPQHVGFGLDIGEGRSFEQYQSYSRHLPVGPFPTWEQRQKGRTRGLETIEGFENLTQGLVAKGYRESDILKILGGNFLRVFRQVVDR
jgi:membrane dipeptidase